MNLSMLKNRPPSLRQVLLINNNIDTKRKEKVKYAMFIYNKYN